MAKYYDDCMPLIIDLIKNFNEMPIPMKGKLIEAVSFLINSVDYEKSKKDVHFYLDQMWKAGKEFSLNFLLK